MNKPLVTINVVVYNGEKYLRYCLDHIRKQSYPNLEVNIFDNASTDSTREIAGEFPEYRFIAHSKNLGMWPGQEQALKHSNGEYIVALSVDVMMHPRFIEEAVTACEADPSIGALQGKIYQYDYDQLIDTSYKLSRIIDTCGFAIAKSRRISNIGHGEEDNGQYNNPGEVFAVEGAVPFMRRSALEGIRVNGEIIDHDYFWYGDDLDFAWRMRIFGWKQWYQPTAIACHNRSTTKGHSKTWRDYLRRVSIRQAIPQEKRILDWSNVMFTIVKNDYIINILRDLPYILVRQVQVFAYWLIFEPKTYHAIPRFFRLLPKMLRKRRVVMAKARVPANRIHQWFQ